MGIFGVAARNVRDLALCAVVLGIAGGFPPVPAGAQALPANDAFAAAEVLDGASGSVAGTNLGATKEAGEPNPVSNNTGGASVWYRWTAPVTAPTTITTVGSSFDTLLTVSTGTDVSSLSLVASNDDLSGSSAQSSVTFSATAGTTYRIVVDGWRTGSVVASGSITLHWSQVAPPTGPPNDAFVAAAVVAGASGSVAGSTVAATKESGEPNHVPANSGGASVWYEWTAPAAGPATVTTVGSSFDTVLSVYTGSSLSGLTREVSNDDISGSVRQSSVAFTAQAATTYRIAVDGWRGASGVATGSVTVNWEVTAPPSAPANDAFNSATAVVGGSGTMNGSNVAASKEAGEPNHVNNNAGGASIWYAWEAPADGIATVTTIGSGFDTVLAVYTGSSVAGLTRLASNDDISGSVRQSSISLDAERGTTYRIAVDGWRTGSTAAAGSVVLHWDLLADPVPPANDHFADAQPIAGPSGNVAGSTVLATEQAGEPNHVPNNAGGASIWFRWIAPEGGRVTVSTAGSTFDTLLAAYTGERLDTLTQVATNDDLGPGSLQSRVAFDVVAGTTIEIAVDGWRTAGTTATGSVALDWSLVGSGDAVLVGAGDIAHCDSDGDEATAALLSALPTATVAMLGDGAYPQGTPEQYANCYDPSWGVTKARTRPTPGNHEYDTGTADGYFGYFGAAAGDPTQGYYSYELGAWHVVVLNSECSKVGGCGVGSPQAQWLEADLASSTAACTVGYWHSPRFSSGFHGSDPRTTVLWQALYDHGADLVLSAHDHDYERFAPQTADGTRDDAFGIRSFVVGTGGGERRPFGDIAPNSQARDAGGHGVLAMTLRPGGYDWRFVPVPGNPFVDSGSGTCHGIPG